MLTVVSVGTLVPLAPLQILLVLKKVLKVSVVSCQNTPAALRLSVHCWAIISNDAVGLGMTFRVCLEPY